MSERITTIDLLRHGACEGGEIYRGSTDVALSEQGWEQMGSAVKAVAGWDRVLSSPLSRCRLFAEQCATDRAIPLGIMDALREMDFGEWEGRELGEVWENDRERVSRFYLDPEHCFPPGGEAMPAVRQRAVEALQDALQSHAGEHLLLVSHGGVIRLLLTHVLDMPLAAVTRLHIPYACLARVRIFHRREGDFPVLAGIATDMVDP